MRPKTSPQPLMQPEVTLNLWAYASADGTVLRLAAKAYVMDGDDALKLRLLRALSATDFLSVAWYPVPKRFTLVNHDGDRLVGAAKASMISEPLFHSQLFAALIEEVAAVLPEQLRSINGDYQPFRLELPESPLAVTTVVLEHGDGQLVPMVGIDHDAEPGRTSRG